MQNKCNIRRSWLYKLAADVLAVIAAYYTTYFLRFHSDYAGAFYQRMNNLVGGSETGVDPSEYIAFYAQSALRLVLILSITICLIYALLDLYAGIRFIRKRATAWDIILANLIAILVFYCYFYISRNIYHPRSIFLSVVMLNSFYAILFRWVVEWIFIMRRRVWSTGWINTVFVGSGREADFLKSFIERVHPHGLRISERIDRGASGVDALLRQVEEAAGSVSAGMIIIADRKLSILDITRFLSLADRLDLPIKILSDEFMVIANAARIKVDLIQGVPLFHFDAPSKTKRYEQIKALTGRAIGLVILLAVLPLMLLMALLIKLTGKGPILFVQERIGVNRRPFMMYKFRTMHSKAEEMQAAVEEFNESGQGLFKIRNDPRVTAIGRLLRRFSLDEFPQLINVLKGDMTIIGPRPLPRRDFQNYYEEWHYERHEGLPGLTCLWQVSGRSDLDFHNMCILDLYYLRNQSWTLDFKIFMRTIWVVIFSDGAY